MRASLGHAPWNGNLFFPLDTCKFHQNSPGQLESEADLIASMEQTIATAAGSVEYELELFDGKMPAADAMALFHSAAVVVGVHGGALTNIVACRPGALLIELGFHAGFTRHYASASQGLGTVHVFRQKITLEDAIGCSLEANMRVTNGIPLGRSLSYQLTL
jgi:hypothetical protein